VNSKSYYRMEADVKPVKNFAKFIYFHFFFFHILVIIHTMFSFVRVKIGLTISFICCVVFNLLREIAENGT